MIEIIKIIYTLFLNTIADLIADKIVNKYTRKHKK